jgi:predicted nucleic acid-binding protein
MRYLDPSLAVSLITQESFTAAAQEWLAQTQEQVAVSDWVITEVSSALSIKQRTGDLDDSARRRAQHTFDVLVRDSSTVLDVPRACFARAADMAGRAALALRSGDALHLAIAQHHGAQLCTRDERQADAGRALGIEVFFLAPTA